MDIYSDNEILGQLALECYRAGGVRKWAVANNCSNSTVSRILKGTQEMTPGIAKILGIETIMSIYCKTGEPDPTGEEIQAYIKRRQRTEKRRAKSKAKQK